LKTIILSNEVRRLRLTGVDNLQAIQADFFRLNLTVLLKKHFFV